MSNTTNRVLPSERPQIMREMIDAWIAEARLSPPAEPVMLVGRRGYYRDTMGNVGVNELNVYDDAISLVTPERVRSFNANTDPSRLYPGVATMLPGAYAYRVGTHGITKPVARRYVALIQDGPVRVRRHGGGTDEGWFGINLHRGGRLGTSSLGCQTIAPDQWSEFLAAVRTEMALRQLTRIWYLLTERPSAA